MATTNLLRTNEAIEQSSDASLFYQIDFTGWFPSDVTTLSNAVLTLLDSEDALVEGKTSSITMSGLTVTFKLSSIDTGNYKLHTKVTCNTGEIDTCVTRVDVPY